MQKTEQKEYIGQGLRLFTDERVKHFNEGRTLDKDIEQNNNHQLVNIARFLLLQVNPSTTFQEMTLSTLCQLCPNWDKEVLSSYVKSDYKTRLVIAGALLSAELDRIVFVNDQLNEFKDDIRVFKTLFEQDDRADRNGNYFKEQFLKHFGVTKEVFLQGVIPIDLGDTFIYLKDDYKISCEIGFWKVEQLEK